MYWPFHLQFQEVQWEPDVDQRTKPPRVPDSSPYHWAQIGYINEFKFASGFFRQRLIETNATPTTTTTTTASPPSSTPTTTTTTTATLPPDESVFTGEEASGGGDPALFLSNSLSVYIRVYIYIYPSSRAATDMHTFLYFLNEPGDPAVDVAPPYVGYGGVGGPADFSEYHLINTGFSGKMCLPKPVQFVAGLLSMFCFYHQLFVVHQ